MATHTEEHTTLPPSLKDPPPTCVTDLVGNLDTSAQRPVPMHLLEKPVNPSTLSTASLSLCVRFLSRQETRRAFLMSVFPFAQAQCRTAYSSSTCVVSRQSHLGEGHSPSTMYFPVSYQVFLWRLRHCLLTFSSPPHDGLVRCAPHAPPLARLFLILDLV